MRRVLAEVLVLVLLAGCGAPNPGATNLASDSPGATNPGATNPAIGSPGATGLDVAGVELAAANVAHLSGTTADATSAGAAINDFGLALYGRLAAGDPSGNLVVSPTSLALALSMARAGAGGQTAAQMDLVLRDLGTDEHAAWVAALDSLLTARTGTFADPTGEPRDVTLRLVNTSFAQRGLAIQPAYLDALAARFGAGLHLVDYVRAAEAARLAINRWVDDQTQQRIPELLVPGIVDDMTRIVLVNAIYLKAAWQARFEVEATTPAPFSLLDGSAVVVPMMRSRGELPYAAGGGWQAVELPYVGGKLSMLVIVPDDLAAFEAALDGDLLAGIAAGLAPRQVALGLPRFSAETHASLARVLADMGMPIAFSEAADFSGITTEEQLAITAVIHQANIDVDEQGTEAAAATAVVIGRVSLPSGVVTLTVDRPFLFALRDTESGAVLFLGRIADPSVGR